MPEYQTHDHDVLVIGAGGAGLRAAIEASASGVSVGLVCKSLLGKAHTVMAEGGVAGIDLFEWIYMLAPAHTPARKTAPRVRACATRSAATIPDTRASTAGWRTLPTITPPHLP